MPLLHSDGLRLPTGPLIYRHSCEMPSRMECSSDILTIMVAAFDALEDAAVFVVVLGRPSSSLSWTVSDLCVPHIVGSSKPEI